jgi:hypothetical protein
LIRKEKDGRRRGGEFLVFARTKEAAMVPGRCGSAEGMFSAIAGLRQHILQMRCSLNQERTTED